MLRIFISYKRADKEKVFKIKDQIEAALGEKCWIDPDGIESDAPFANVILKAIDDCEVFLFMYSSEHTNIVNFEHDWTVRELFYAFDKKKRIVFLKLDGAEFTNWFKLLFGTQCKIDTASYHDMKLFINDLKKWLNITSYEEEQQKHIHDDDFQNCYKELGSSSNFDHKKEKDLEINKLEDEASIVAGENAVNSIPEMTGTNELYNVFISCKREDYTFAQPIHDYLVENGLKVFFADAELKQIAESQYADVIDEALDATRHLIVVATSIENIKSKWVKYEWSTFSNDLKSNYRDGNLITILSRDITPRMLPASLRHMQSFSIEDYKDVFPYVKK